MNIYDYTEPYEPVKQNSHLSKGLSVGEILKQVTPTQVDYDVALIGIANDTNGTTNKGSAICAETIRKELYSLRGGFKNIYVSDVGNIKSNTVRDAYFALEEVVAYLIRNRVIPVIIGGSNDFALPLFSGVKSARKQVNFVTVDQTLDATDSEDFDHRNYLKPLLNDPDLLSFSLIGYQSYLYDELQLKAYQNFPQNIIRLGQLRKQIHITEPIFRDADMVAVDMSAVRLADGPGVRYGSPNGLFGEELCQLARYAGFSDRISLFSLFETNPECDLNNQTSKLAAQAIWHFLDGLDKRYKDYPVRDISTYKKFVVQQSDIDHEMVFYNNPQNNRWWLEIDAVKQMIVSCTIDDYHYARANKIPDVYYKWHKHLK
ncbi:arginase family protein [Saccharicrinis sp. FJH54]|uniref:arginase family protein n=1 Tax=Saccharicrinis sp. FJH54 TaxID=3344665 RepID=UPI0035D45DD1